MKLPSKILKFLFILLFVKSFLSISFAQACSMTGYWYDIDEMSCWNGYIQQEGSVLTGDHDYELVKLRGTISGSSFQIEVFDIEPGDSGTSKCIATGRLNDNCISATGIWTKHFLGIPMDLKMLNASSSEIIRISSPVIGQIFSITTEPSMPNFTAAVSSNYDLFNKINGSAFFISGMSL